MAAASLRADTGDFSVEMLIVRGIEGGFHILMTFGQYGSGGGYSYIGN